MTTIGYDNIVLDTLNHRGAKYSTYKELDNERHNVSFAMNGIYAVALLTMTEK